MVHKSYFKRQVTTLMKFAQSTSDPKLVAALVEKAVDLKSQVDDATPPPDLSPRPPDEELG
jgi:PleD family two-component response regulator